MILSVLDDLAELTDTIGREPDALPTPCAEFDVHTLRRHLLGWLVYFDTALGDPGGDDRPDPAAFPGPDEPGAVIGRLAATIRSAVDAGVARTIVKVPQLGGAYPGATVIDLLLIEVLGHGWDLARATGRPWQPDAATCEHALAVLRGMVRPEFRGPGLPFGPEVAVPAGAPALDRLVAFTGRDPSWTRL